MTIKPFISLAYVKSIGLIFCAFIYIYEFLSSKSIQVPRKWGTSAQPEICEGKNGF